MFFYADAQWHHRITPDVAFPKHGKPIATNFPAFNQLACPVHKTLPVNYAKGNMMLQKISCMLKNESAATAVEYALLLAMIAALLLASVVSAGGAAGMTFGSNAEAIDGALK